MYVVESCTCSHMERGAMMIWFYVYVMFLNMFLLSMFGDVLALVLFIVLVLVVIVLGFSSTNLRAEI